MADDDPRVIPDCGICGKTMGWCEHTSVEAPEREPARVGSAWWPSPVGIDMPAYEDPREGDPFGDVNLDWHSDMSSGYSYPRRLEIGDELDPGRGGTGENFALGSAMAPNLCQVCGRDMGNEIDVCPYCLNGAQHPENTEGIGMTGLGHLIGAAHDEGAAPRMLPVLSASDDPGRQCDWCGKNEKKNDPVSTHVMDEVLGDAGDVDLDDVDDSIGSYDVHDSCARKMHKSIIENGELGLSWSEQHNSSVRRSKVKSAISRRDMSMAEKLALIDEEGDALNKTKFDLAGTHYVTDVGEELATGLGFGL